MLNLGGVLVVQTRAERFSQNIFHLICVKNYVLPKEEEDYVVHFEQGMAYYAHRVWATLGGHIWYMTIFPWAHLLFPESVIMRERRRFRPDENAQTFEQTRGGLNKMTLERFKKIVKESGLAFEYFKKNVSRRKLGPIFRLMRRIPFCEEYFTIDVCSIARLKR
jgi:hypothetical protein